MRTADKISTLPAIARSYYGQKVKHRRYLSVGLNQSQHMYTGLSVREEEGVRLLPMSTNIMPSAETRKKGRPTGKSIAVVKEVHTHSMELTPDESCNEGPDEQGGGGARVDRYLALRAY